MVDGCKKVFGEVWNEGGDGLEVTFRVPRGETAEEVARVVMAYISGVRNMKRGGRDGGNDLGLSV